MTECTTRTGPYVIYISAGRTDGGVRPTVVSSSRIVRYVYTKYEQYISYSSLLRIYILSHFFLYVSHQFIFLLIHSFYSIQFTTKKFRKQRNDQYSNNNNKHIRIVKYGVYGRKQNVLLPNRICAGSGCATTALGRTDP